VRIGPRARRRRAFCRTTREVYGANPHATILGPRLCGYERPLRPRTVKPYVELVGVESEDVRPEAPPAAELPASVPA